jgi:NADPH:quinone reductase-like Zn-dependent oxidoreductase
MKASFFRAFGGPEVLQYGDLPDPVPAAGEVVVDIHAASVNAADWKMRAGQYSADIHFPHVPGRDFSGVVAALGESAGDFKVGDEAFGVCEVPREGAYAEKIAIRQAILARKPASLTHVQCASIALAGLTALISIEETLELKSGETILIHGGAGGVAGFAIALAKHLGARVVTTASAANHDYVRALGADEAIDYGAQDFTRVVSGCDAVFDTVGGDVTPRSFAVLRPGGRLASIAGGVASAPAWIVGRVARPATTCAGGMKASSGGSSGRSMSWRRSSKRSATTCAARSTAPATSAAAHTTVFAGR